ncbi:hypothetical protein EK21DRAFT_85573 [Setomelanomma holmii]|uniref:Uncharacterized protein n=1 Tax=Setomelanomma holmii TaxID=210430 RepID=A0A9P4LRA4_9PLEO|nr:hypothetical protein EK21DRAFT_85573 [Setomelanomma holmii]
MQKRALYAWRRAQPGWESAVNTTKADIRARKGSAMATVEALQAMVSSKAVVERMDYRELDGEVAALVRECRFSGAIGSQSDGKLPRLPTSHSYAAAPATGFDEVSVVPGQLSLNETDSCRVGATGCECEAAAIFDAGAGSSGRTHSRPVSDRGGRSTGRAARCGQRAHFAVHGGQRSLSCGPFRPRVLDLADDGGVEPLMGDDVWCINLIALRSG